MSGKNRAFELDALRGFALFLMMCHHTIFDFRYLLGMNLFAFQDSNWFNYLLQPIFLCIFIGVSGVCCQFSRNNLKRSLKLLLLALGFSAVMCLFSWYTHEGLYVFFNILHLLFVGTFLYGLFALWEDRHDRKLPDNATDQEISKPRREIGLIILTGALLFSDRLIDVYAYNIHSYWLLPLGFLPSNFISMGDYLPILPWLGFFFMGVVIGRMAYKGKKTLFPDAPHTVLRAARPFEWLGRNSLLIYLIHQPIILAILFGLRYLGVW